MYLNLSSQITLKASDIIGVFDMDTATVSPVSKSFLKKASRNEKVIFVGSELPKSFILCTSGDVYLCSFSVSAICNRLANSRY